MSLLSERLRALRAARSRAGSSEPYGAAAASSSTIVGAVVGVAAVAGILGRVAGGAPRGGGRRGGCCGSPSPPPTCPPRRDRRRGHLAVDDAGRDFYLIDTAFVEAHHRTQGLEAAHPRHRRQRDRADLRRPRRPRARRGVDHAQLRLQPRRRRPDRQRLVERRPARPILEEAGPLPGADAILQTSDDGWTCGTPLERDHRRPQRDARGRHERRAAADRARLPGAHDRARPLRLRVGHQVGRRHGGHHASTSSTPSGPSGAGASSGRSRCPRASRCRAPATRSGPARSSRRHRLVTAHRHLGGRGRRRRRLLAPAELAGSPNNDCWVQWQAVLDVERGRPHRCGSARPTGTAWCRPASCATCCPTAPPAGTRSTSRRA